MKWIKLSTNMFGDSAIKIIEAMPEHDSILVIWIKLLCLAGSEENSGVLQMENSVTYTDEMLAAMFNRPITTVRLAMQTFLDLGMIENVGGTYVISSWEKHQGSEQVEKYRAQHAARMRRYREKQRVLASGQNQDMAGTRDVYSSIYSGITVMPSPKDETAGKPACGTERDVYGSVTVTQTDKDKDKDKDINNYIGQFESIWSDYPRKEKKQKAFKAFKSAIKSGVSPDTIHAKVLEYAEHVKDKDRQYIAQGGTWFYNRRWEDEYSPIQTIDADFQSLIDAQEEWGDDA